ncbi:UNVERIFIED_CONTAM: hypothetical protein Sradi_4890200 [Sesamum radiatum]|uniref:Uncharacterized protein n=1 Tax=Sesamum radiatum TaxID=300843 RepID=A0AAW2MEK9_SESRA
MPKAVYTLTKEQKRRICEWITHLKFPDGYASNLARCVDFKELRLHSMNTHDCYVFMQKLISIAFRKMLSDSMWSALIEVKSDLIYTGNELLKLHYWGPTEEVTTFQSYFVNDYNFHTERHNVEYPSMKKDKVDWIAVCKTKATRVINDSRWTEVAFQEDETIHSPQVVTDIHNYELHDPNGIQLVIDLVLQISKKQVHPARQMVNLIRNLTKIALTRISRSK